ncbi:nicotinamide-nucleotide amidohydrolase family protein [Vibrio coralliirubri]|uniref:nicotinamide-nucleotide amidohydrolase family protein n=1 Tax=Vibrio coralliirubri TaxID=1516159 RepID=UPI002283FE2C|nr:nicotinamide-nucleotide amidohydrolase family protein [Vibrio coralliirubri]MCY9861150.1 nicotinamide-nucleotide amidohydrolase family protein [Vibrio coralliirubri]
MNNKIQEIHDTLKRANLTIATAESITAGLLQDALAKVSGASRVFRGGITAYDIDTKEDLLGIDRVNAEDCNCVSESTVREMAQGACELFRTDVGIATTGYAEPHQSNLPQAYYAIVINGDIVSGYIDLKRIDGRKARREAVCDHVINQLHAALFERFPTTEIEYKFAIKPEFLEDIKQNADFNLKIKQCYIATNESMTTRIRIIDDSSAYETTKLDDNVEVEYEIPLGKARMIYNSFAGGVGTVEKTRYVFNGILRSEELKIEVDVFEGRHSGFVVAEVEVPYEDYKLTDLPHWIDIESEPEVTSNATIAMIE